MQVPTFTGLPDLPAIAELARLPQWVAWRYEERNGRLTKPPVSPRSGFGASHSKPSDWGSYEQARQMAVNRSLPGVRFVLTANDEYTGIDLDKCIDEHGTIEPWALDIVELGETYAEISPSGRGIRFFARGKVEKTIKSDKAHIEIYSELRYLTVTGNHLDGTPRDIHPAPKTIAALMARIDSLKAEEVPAAPALVPLAQATTSKMEVVRTEGGSDFFRNVNTRALQHLARWVPALFGPAARHYGSTGAYRVSSKSLGRNLEEDLSIAPDGIVDFGVADQGDAREGRRTPIDLVIEYNGAADAVVAAEWLCEKLGVTPASLGRAERLEASAADYAMARQILEAADGTLADAETGEVIEAALPAPRPDLGFPPGLVGDIAQWIVDTARRPQPELSLGAALALVGTVAGRQFCGPTWNATHLYVLALAPSGKGKEHVLQQISRVMNAAGLARHLGPSQFISMPAVINLIRRKPLSLCPIDEFGSFLKRINSRRASGWEQAIAKELRTLWGKSFAPYATPEWAGKESEDVQCPAMTLFGASTAGQFYSAMDGASLEDGTLNRFTIVEGGSPADRDPEFSAVHVPPQIVDGLRDIYFRSGEQFAAQLNDFLADPAAGGAIRRLEWGDDAAHALFRSFVDEIEAKGEDPETGPFYARTVEMALRIATVVAIGRNGLELVRLEDLEFGIALARRSAETMIAGAADYMAETEHHANTQKVLRVVKDRGGRIKHSDLLRSMQHVRSRDLKDMVAAMCEAEMLERQEVEPARGGKAVTWYRLMPRSMG